jgi:Trypsin
LPLFVGSVQNGRASKANDAFGVLIMPVDGELPTRAGFDCAVALFERAFGDRPRVLGTGVLVGPRHVLTAQHVVANAVQNIYVHSARDLAFTAKIAVKKVTFSNGPSFQRSEFLALGKMKPLDWRNEELAMLTLDQAITTCPFPEIQQSLYLPKIGLAEIFVIGAGIQAKNPVYGKTLLAANAVNLDRVIECPGITRRFEAISSEDTPGAPTPYDSGGPYLLAGARLELTAIRNYRLFDAAAAQVTAMAIAVAPFHSWLTTNLGNTYE